MIGRLLALALALGFLAAPAIAETERIRDYTSEITVHPDGGLTIVETISVVATGNKIKRGIYRDFPTDYTDSHGNRIRVGFDVVEVLRDGSPEPYFTERQGNGVRVYVGQKSVFLAPDHYSYTLTYRTDRQLGFFDDFDELYFNAIGHGWEFAIERAKVVVFLPAGAEVLSSTAFTGRQGSTGSDFTSGPGANNGIVFRTTRQLGPGEGLTIVVAWPKGFVAEPTGAESAGYLLRDNASILAGLIGLLVVAAYYLFAWNKVGRDPETGTIVPLFEPPDDFSPAAVRFVMGMGYDKKAFTAAVVNMAVKGYLTIDEDDDEFTLRRKHRNSAALSRGEKNLAFELFGSNDAIRLHHTNHKRVQKAIKALKRYLKAEFEKNHFLHNRGYFIPGAVISGLALLAIGVGAQRPDEAGFMMIWLSGWTAGCYFLVSKVVENWRLKRYLASLFMVLFTAPFLGGEVMGLWMLSEAASPVAAALLFAIILVNALFYHLLKAPTLTGRRAMDRIEGFKLYLGVAEKDRLEAFHPPETTPELFEKFLPYDLALDVENQWGERFEATLAAAGRDQTYRPAWYSGHGWHRHGIGGLGTSLGGSFSNAIASSATPPGSSSGGGGGGFSGGGGGGGGGGW